MAGLFSLDLSPENGIPFRMTEGEVLAATSSGDPVIGLVPAGAGEVVILADSALLNTRGSQHNTTLWENLAHYAAGR